MVPVIHIVFFCFMGRHRALLLILYLLLFLIPSLRPLAKAVVHGVNIKKPKVARGMPACGAMDCSMLHQQMQFNCVRGSEVNALGAGAMPCLVGFGRRV